MLHHELTAATGLVVLDPRNQEGTSAVNATGGRSKGRLMAHFIDPTIEKTCCGLYRVDDMPMVPEDAEVPADVERCGRCVIVAARAYP